MSISSDPKGRGITVTIKYGKGFEETWAVFHGLPDEVREDIQAYFGISEAGDLTLSELVVNATQLAHAKGNVGRYLGGTVIAQGGSAAAGDDVWAEAGRAAQAATPAEPAEPERDPIYGQIEACADGPALKRLWAANQAKFADPEVMAAWKARGKSLSG